MRSTFAFVSSLDEKTAEETGSVAGSKMLLLMSTCNDIEATFNACAYEIHAWIGKERLNFDRVISFLDGVNWEALVDDVDQSSQSDLFGGHSEVEIVQRRTKFLNESVPRVRLSSLIGNCRSYLVQYRHKRSLFFEEFEVVKDGLASFFARDHQASIFWQERVEQDGFLSSRSDRRFNFIFEILDKTEDAAWRLMDVIEAILADASVWTAGGPGVASDHPRQLPPCSEAMTIYNESVDQLHNLRVGKVLVGKFNTQETKAIEGNLTFDDVRTLIAAVGSRFSELKELVALWIPIYDRYSATPFTPSKIPMVGNDGREILRDQYLVMFDLINSKLSPPEVKVEVERALNERNCIHEPTGDDSWVLVVPTWDDVLSVVKLIRHRTAAFLKQDGYGGLRTFVSKGDCVTRRISGHQGTAVIITDREGTPELPKTGYQLDLIKPRIASHEELNSEDESNGVVVDRGIAIELTGSNNDECFAPAGLIALGSWEHKDLSGEMFFYRPPPEGTTV